MVDDSAPAIEHSWPAEHSDGHTIPQAVKKKKTRVLSIDNSSQGVSKSASHSYIE